MLCPVCSFPDAAAKLVCQLLQLPTLRPAPISMRQLVQGQEGSSSSSGSCEPVLFVTTAGADPSQELAAFAEAEIGRDRLHEVAMGQGQADVALQLLRQCAQSGKWWGWATMSKLVL
jgi:dynein heavy chain 2